MGGLVGGTFEDSPRPQGRRRPPPTDHKSYSKFTVPEVLDWCIRILSSQRITPRIPLERLLFHLSWNSVCRGANALGPCSQLHVDINIYIHTHIYMCNVKIMYVFVYI